jgi:hypothetical protein
LRDIFDPAEALPSHKAGVSITSGRENSRRPGYNAAGEWRPGVGDQSVSNVTRILPAIEQGEEDD